MRLPSLLVLATLLFSGAAHAQDSGGILEFLTTSGTTFSPLTTTGAVVLVVLLTRDKAETPGEEAEAAEEAAAEAARLYLQHNAVQLAQDLATGDGPLVQELASALRLRPAGRSDFAGLLRADRHALADLACPDRLDGARALAFVARLHRLLTNHPTLREDLARLASDS